MSIEGSTKIINVMPHPFLPRAFMTKEKCNKNQNFMPHGTWVLVLGRDYIGHRVIPFFIFSKLFSVLRHRLEIYIKKINDKQNCKVCDIAVMGRRGC